MPVFQDPHLHSVCGDDLLHDLVCSAGGGGEGDLVPGVLLPLPVPSDGGSRLCLTFFL